MSILKSLHQNYQFIKSVYSRLLDCVDLGMRMSAASEWLIDNFYVIEQLVLDISLNFDKKTVKRLPRRNDTPVIYTFARALTDIYPDKLCAQTIIEGIAQKQEEYIFNSQELWILEAMLKICMVEKISLICKDIKATQDIYQKTYVLTGRSDFEKLDFSKIKNQTYIESLVYFFKKKENSEQIIAKMNAVLSTDGKSLSSIIANEYENQAKIQIHTGQLISSLLTLSHIDFLTIYQQTSKLESLLQLDPTGLYPQMDDTGQSSYRKQIEKITTKYHLSEQKVMDTLLSLCEKADDGKKRHVGYYLTGDGYTHLIYTLFSKKPMDNKARLNLFFLCNIGISIVLSLAFGLLSGNLFWAIIFFFPAAKIVGAVFNFVTCIAIKPIPLPRLDTDKLIDLPRTLVVIPALVTGAESCARLFDNLERYYISNQGQNLCFAVAGDFKDRTEKTLPQDQQIMDAANEKVQQLNDKYSQTLFYYFQRKPKYNKNTEKYMGYERKRGALVELCAMLKNRACSYFPCDIPQNIQYIITLDADTCLVPGSAKKLIGSMLHLLNRPVLNREKTCVISGHGIMTPQIITGLESGNKSTFARLFSGQSGIDPYAVVVSDVYQDLFQEGIFTGKGIFDLDTFDTVLRNALPDNTILSHDLIEGSYLRCGFLSDIALQDTFPDKYNSYSQREHRWIRGDFQILPWLFKTVHNQKGQTVPNPISALSKWKIFDNLRRSLTPFFILTSVLLSFLPCLYCGSIALTALFIPVIINIISATAGRHFRYFGQKQYGPVIHGVKGAFLQAFCMLAFLPHTAYNAINAAVTSLYRILISHKNMLQWVTAAEQDKTGKHSVFAYYKKMIICPIGSALLLVICHLLSPGLFWFALVLSWLWLIAPLIAWRISLPYHAPNYAMDAHDKKEVLIYSRKIWSFFEDFIREETHYLPPDNFQKSPLLGAANRTSPTNIGITLLSVLCAYELGFITQLTLLSTLENIIATIEKLEKWHGHLYNWYNTKNCKLLRPTYVSTVDSGNFVNYLYVLRSALSQIADKDLFDNPLIGGLETTLALCETKESIAIHDLYGDSEKLFSMIENKQIGGVYALRLKTMLTDVRYLLSCDPNMAQNLCHDRAFDLQKRVDAMIGATDFSKLYVPERDLFSIGYDITQNKLSNNLYDLFASEARGASYVAIAKGDVPIKHWFKMSRTLVTQGSYSGLASWSGTMFEYFMPRLIMKDVPGSLLSESYKFVVAAQMNYGKRRKVPWGVSESAFYEFDRSLNYQYKAFGLPNLGFKAGLVKDTVIAPYATALGMMEARLAALKNLRRLKSIGAEGSYGFYEAIDYTPGRQLKSKQYTVVKSFMVHHIGMSLLAFTNTLSGNILQSYFHACPEIAAYEYLLEERAPLNIKTDRYHIKIGPMQKVDFRYESAKRTISQNTAIPQVNLLSNSSLCTMVDSHGGGYTKSGKIMLAPFRPSMSETLHGTHLYIRNVSDNHVFSPAPRPISGGEYQTTFHSHKASFQHANGDLQTLYEIGVSPEDSFELRQLQITNLGTRDKILEVTSYAELSLSPPDAEMAHPAFTKLFIDMQYDREKNIFFATRRPREPHGEDRAIAFSKMHLFDVPVLQQSFESDKETFLGRQHTPATPDALGRALTNSDLPSPSPAFAMRIRFRVPAGKNVTLSLMTGVMASRFDIYNLFDKYNSPSALRGVFEAANARNKIVNKFLTITAPDEVYIQNLLSLMIYPHRHGKDNISVPGNLDCLWQFGISGDLPLLVFIANNTEDLSSIRLLVKAHEYWRLRGFESDFAIVYHEDDHYNSPFKSSLGEITNTSKEFIGTRGGIFFIDKDGIANSDIQNLISMSNVTLCGKDKLTHSLFAPSAHPPHRHFYYDPMSNQTTNAHNTSRKSLGFSKLDLDFYNGLGGFDRARDEYVINLCDFKNTPLPWSNIIANHQFGTLVTESGNGYTYFHNSRENKLTPWSNDPITDPPSEMLYFKSDDKLFSITASPFRNNGQYVARHGKGYTTYHHTFCGADYTQTVFVAKDDPVKFNLVTIENKTAQTLNFSVFYAARPVLGQQYEQTARHMQVTYEQDTLFASHSLTDSQKNQRMFLATSEKIKGYCAGYDEVSRFPDHLSNTTATNGRPLMALHSTISVFPNTTKQFVCILGASDNHDQALALVEQHANIDNAEKQLDTVKQEMQTFLDKLTVKTSSKSLDLMVNSYLPYQTYVCRMLARSAFYQVSGAHGYRDQLQDSLGLILTHPHLARKQILIHAARQFPEGDVLHWWHTPPEDEDKYYMGIRTHFSDDMLWLPYAVFEYIEKTGDESILDEQISYLCGPPLEEDQGETYIRAHQSNEMDTVYGHCLRAIDYALKYGPHGLPLMGIGDWNDGMNMVGNKGLGESVWLGFFLYDILGKFSGLCLRRKHHIFFSRYQDEQKCIKSALDTAGWDGEWFRRAYFDNGSTMGSALNMECKIDLIAQCWSVISGGGDLDKNTMAIDSAIWHLVDDENNIIRLLTPAFDKFTPNPGYIKSYIKGVRENGGQYSHGAVWLVIALAMMGRADEAMKMLNMLNPISHTISSDDVATYKCEPYVMCGDVYSAEGMEGRGGWSWYTGSSSWMYTAIVEYLLGIKKMGEKLVICPVLPADFGPYSFVYQYGTSTYHVTVTPGMDKTTNEIMLIDNGKTHHIEIVY